MMAVGRFVMHNDARKFFEKIGLKGRRGGKSDTGKFETFFDAYWICAQIGIMHDRYEDPGGSKEAPEMTRNFRGLSKSHKHLISGVAFYKYCEQRGKVDADDMVLKEMGNFFSEEYNTLNEAGCKLLNGYSYGGFNVIFDRVGEDCHHLHEFLLQCYELIGE